MRWKKAVRIAVWGVVALLAAGVLWQRGCGDARRLEAITLPRGFAIALYADSVPDARSLALGARGTVFVGSRGAGVVYALVDTNRDARADEVITLVRDLDTPNGLTFSNGALYVALTSRVLRYDAIEERLRHPPAPVVLTDRLPTEGHHGWRYIAMGPDRWLYIASGAPCNICNPPGEQFATILRMRPRRGAELQVFARGVRNSVGFDWHPRTRDLWFSDNGRDWLGSDEPPDELNRAPAIGMHFGYPFCHGATILDEEFGAQHRCADYAPPERALDAHVAALGMRFYTGTMFPPEYRGRIFIAEHGSWNRIIPVGYRRHLVRSAFRQGSPCRYPRWLSPRNFSRYSTVEGARLINEGTMHRVVLSCSILLLAASEGRAQTADSASRVPPVTKQVRAVRLEGSDIMLDGRLDEPAWNRALWISDFTQKMPQEGAPPTDSMRIALFYDNDALYVGARMYSRDPSKLQAPLSRRDNTAQADHLWVSFDSYHDKRTAYSFGVTASGVRMDWYHPTDNEYEMDMGFDPVWEGKANIDEQGWTAEMRIPFSQLRFTDRPNQVWGFNADHWNPATSEDVFWIPVPTNRTGWSSFMGELVGIEGIRPSRRLELMPYGAADARFQGGVDPADPFHSSSDFSGRAGADVKMGLGPNITLDGTVNPDFGQVEADPSVVNLSAFEVFFDEKRPFFTEGSQLLRGNGPSYFYSRRIGARPGCAASGDFVDCPQSATILGAAKVTGRLANGMSLGGLAALTSRERARTYTATTNTFGRTVVAPTAGYGVARLQQEFGASKSVVGVTLTTVQRAVPSDTALLRRYNRHAYAGGADWVIRWDRGAYVLRGWLGFSHMRGDSSVINRVQRSGVHFFQRPDARRYTHYDSTRTSLTGSVANTEFSKTKGNFLYSFGAGWESPAYDPNDAGRLGNADGRFGYLNLNYRQTKPRGKLQSWNVGLSNSTEYDFGGDRQYHVAELFANFTFKNFWNFNTYVDYFPASFDHSATRGGPTMRTTQSWNWVAQLGNSFGAKTSWNARIYYGEDELGGETYRLSGRLSIRPSTRFQFSAQPNYLRAISSRQYVATFPGGPPATYGSRYVFAWIDQSTFLMQLRANYTIGPDLTLELYGEPFAASGTYHGFGDLAAARTFSLVEYSADTTAAHSVIRWATDSVTFKDGGSRITIPNPDFNFLLFNSNAVLRWEWRPGSTLYLVWAQSRRGFTAQGKLVGFSELFDSFGAQGDNFLALKVSYWIPVQ